MHSSEQGSPEEDDLWEDMHGLVLNLILHCRRFPTARWPQLACHVKPLQFGVNDPSNPQTGFK
eukprot:4920154-Amphidinium_carterae.1